MVTTTMLSTERPVRPLCSCGEPLTDLTAPMCRSCFRCDGHNHWVEISGQGGVRITSCIDPSCSFSLVD